MINVQKQIEYWKKTGESDFQSAELLIKNNRILHGLFFCHLCIEKLLKAHVTKVIKNVPPKTHDLTYLHKLSKIELNEEQIQFLAVLMNYLLEGRYPEYYPQKPNKMIANQYLIKTKDLFKCLKKML